MNQRRFTVRRAELLTHGYERMPPACPGCCCGAATGFIKRLREPRRAHTSPGARVARPPGWRAEVSSCSLPGRGFGGLLRSWGRGAARVFSRPHLVPCWLPRLGSVWALPETCRLPERAPQPRAAPGGCRWRAGCSPEFILGDLGAFGLLLAETWNLTREIYVALGSCWSPEFNLARI